MSLVKTINPAVLWAISACAAVLSILMLVAMPLGLAWAADTVVEINSAEDAVKWGVRVIGTWKTVSFMVVLVGLSQVGLWALRKIPWLRAALERRGLLTVAGGLCGAIGAAATAWAADQKERIPEAAASGFVLGASWAHKPAEKKATPTDAEVIAARVALPAGTKPGPV